MAVGDVLANWLLKVTHCTRNLISAGLISTGKKYLEFFVISNNGTYLFQGTK